VNESDRTLERWAGWRGRPNRFARALRSSGVLTCRSFLRSLEATRKGKRDQEAAAERIRGRRKHRSAVMDRDGGKCRKCGSNIRLELDHIVPIAKGGKSERENLQLLCRKCNGEKGAR
jgi:5-methylcytosine-specific restriction endonuclease McrA